MTLIQRQRRQQSQKLKKDIQCLIHEEMRRMSPWWFVSFHYRDHHGEEDRILEDVADLKRKLCRFIYKTVIRPSMVLVLTRIQDDIYP